MNSAFRSGSSPFHRCTRPVRRCSSRSIKHWRNKKRDVKINVGTHARLSIFFSSVFNIQIRIHIPYFYAVLCCALVLASLFICSFVLPSPFSFGNFYHLPFKKYFSLGKKEILYDMPMSMTMTIWEKSNMNIMLVGVALLKCWNWNKLWGNLKFEIEWSIVWISIKTTLD